MASNLSLYIKFTGIHSAQTLCWAEWFPLTQVSSLGIETRGKPVSKHVVSFR